MYNLSYWDKTESFVYHKSILAGSRGLALLNTSDLFLTRWLVQGALGDAAKATDNELYDPYPWHKSGVILVESPVRIKSPAARRIEFCWLFAQSS